VLLVSERLFPSAARRACPRRPSRPAPTRYLPPRLADTVRGNRGIVVSAFRRTNPA